MRIIVEGWRFLPHSYSLINQFLLLELLDRPEIQVYHRDMPYVTDNWQPVTGLLGDTREPQLHLIPQPPADQSADAILRVYCPFNLAPSTAPRTVMFGCTEWGIVPHSILRGMGVSSFQEAHQNSDTIIVTASHWSRDGFIRSGADPDRVVVIPLGVDPHFYQPASPEKRLALRQQFGIEDNFVFFTNGLLFNNRHGMARLLRAFAALVKKFPEARLILKGRDYLFEARQEIARICSQALTATEQKMVQERLTYIGKNLSCADLAALYQIADAYVSPYLAEGFNLPVLEAAACGLPVICTQGGPTDDFIHPDFAFPIQSQLEQRQLESGEMGFVVAPNVDHLIHLMEQIIEQPALQEKARQAGPKWVGDRYTWKHVVDQYLQVLGPQPQPSFTAPIIHPIQNTATRKLIVEGWRFQTHSYAIANQFQLLEMLKYPNLELFHQDIAFLDRNSQPAQGLFDAESDSALRAIAPPPPNLFADATLRMYSPFNFKSALQSERTYLFGTTEWGIVHKELLRLNPGESLEALHQNSNTVIITSSQWSKAGFLRSGADPNRVVTVPLGVDTSRYKPLKNDERAAVRKELGWQEDEFIFLNVSSMTLEKGIFPIIFCFTKIIEKYPKARLVLKGSDLIYKSWESIVFTCGKILSDRALETFNTRLTYIGNPLPSSELIRYYQAADGYLSPYSAEGFNLPVLEAAACGLPVICTQGGPTDEFTHPDFALQIKSEVQSVESRGEMRHFLAPDWDCCITLMEQLISQSAWREQVRISGPQFVRDRLSWKQIVAQLLDVIFPSNPPQLSNSVTLPSLLETPSPTLQERVASFPFWYHKIELPGGIVTPGDHPQNAEMYGVPEDLSGKRVLDVGAWDGYWTFEALKRGAREVVAIDDFSDFLGRLDQRDRRAWKTFDLCREALGFDETICQRLEKSVYELSESELGRFDVIFFFGTLDHLRYPLLALDKLSALCDGEIYIESAILDDFSSYQGGIGKGYPGQQRVMEFYPHDEYAGNSSNYWVPTLYCLGQMVKSSGFTQVKGWKLVQNPPNWEGCRGFAIGTKAQSSH
ncbi:glycosyltransferase [Laspinema olomoucense]|uniref:glycosyltransferase n=1 Tax=Laspinema olomoucense TaxID=3231600 RepID=UPI0021BADC12|nr:glycosyltransferase [Laspinema sp. D3c]MCT7996725.1 glycosyltransferase [Laspinema sp. D3c]